MNAEQPVVRFMVRRCWWSPGASSGLSDPAGKDEVCSMTALLKRLMALIHRHRETPARLRDVATAFRIVTTRCRPVVTLLPLAGYHGTTRLVTFGRIVPWTRPMVRDVVTLRRMTSRPELRRYRLDLELGAAVGRKGGSGHD